MIRRSQPAAHHVRDILMSSHSIPVKTGSHYARVEQHRTIIAGVIRQTAMTISPSRAVKFAATPEFHKRVTPSLRLLRVAARSGWSEVPLRGARRARAWGWGVASGGALARGAV